jgi:AraC-like DNA-binding protein
VTISDISKYHFIRLFKRYYGCTPHQYLKEVRVRKAKKLIQNGMTVRDLETFCDYNYWANKKILPVVGQLTTEEFTRPVAGGYGIHKKYNSSYA